MTTVFRREESERATRFVKLSCDRSLETRRTTIIELRGLVLVILLVATLLIPNYLKAGRLYVPGKFMLFVIPMAVTSIYAWHTFDSASIKEWLRETLWFVGLIFPLMLVGVFVVGIIKALLPEE